MAHHLQKVAIALLIVSSGAYGAGFSHRTHLKLKIQCVACHAGAASSTNVADNNLPSPQICAGCHSGSGSAPKLEPRIKQPRKTNVTRFNHQLHLKLGNVAPVIARAIDAKSYLSPPGDLRRHLATRNACAACHRGLDTSDQVDAKAFPAMADCLVCHSKIDPPFSCGYCHEEGPHLKPANHTKDFLDAHTSGKLALDKTTCAVCHGRRFTCLGCH